MKNIIIGGGAAGMMAAYSSVINGNDTILLEKNEKLGKKVYITGKGRCNLTNYCSKEEFLKNVVSNPKFLFSSLNRMDSYDTVELFNNLGLKTKTERGNRVFPESDKASDVTKTLEKVLRSLGVDIRFNCRVLDIKTEGGRFASVITDSYGEISGDSCIIATGGLSYPSTGSTGDGYRIADKNGHTITELLPSLVGLKTEETFVREMEGLSLKNIVLKVFINGKQKFKEQGEMLFTHNGVSGPLILTVSADFAKDIASGKQAELVIDMKPALSYEELDARILRDFGEMSNKALKNVLIHLLPSSMVPVLIGECGIDGEKKVNSVTVEERKKLADTIKAFKLHVKNSGDFSEAVVTKGGIKVSEVNPGTMESKLVKGLYFAGEILDVDAYTGGFNLQIAWTTGYTAGMTLGATIN
ncbi:MAG: NAD(P)/FAD-dependent oxidoreductase [Lachnospiraceae bacterium]|nr:NAD(P)/FAD-dependent oxidoreductase [Lachnospiraceae bacterium]